MDNVQIKDNMSFKVKSIKIENHQSTQLKGKNINMVKVVWVDRFGDSSWEIIEYNVYNNYSNNNIKTKFIQ